MKWRNDFVKIFTAFGLAVAVMTTVLTTIRQPMEMYAAEENDTALQELQELAEEKYTAEKKTGFHLSLRDHVFDGNTGLDYSGDVPGEREYMEVFQNLLRSENDQTIVFRFRTTVENCLLFGTGSMPEGDNGTNMGFALQNGKLRVMFRNEKTTGGLRGNLGDILADGEWHTVAVSFLPSRGIGQENLYVVVDGEANIYPVSWYAAWAGGFNQQTSVPYTTFEIGKGKFSANSQLATAAFSGEMDFITVVDEAYDVKRLQEITSGDKSLKNFARSMMAAGSNKIWLFTGGTETVADFLDTEAARNYVGLFEEGIRASGSYIERSKFVFNTAKKGAGIAELIEEYDSRIKGYGASAVGIMVGEADYKKGEKGLEEFKENLKVLTEKIIGDGMVPFLMTPYASAEREKQKNVEKYSDAIVETVGETLKVIDLSSIDTANVRADGSLTQAGHQIVGNQIKTDLGIGFTTNFSFSLQGGTYTVAKQADDGSEAVLQDVTASEDSISVTVADKDGLKLGCDLTDPEGQVISVRVEDAQNTFTVDGLKPNTNYVLSVYNLGRESDESVKETYRPVEIRTAKGGAGKDSGLSRAADGQ